jgi:hypothetical protein
MTQKSILRTLFLPAVAVCLVLCSGVALADPIDAAGKTMPGCEQKVFDAMNHKADARNAYDVASTEQVIDQPDSILALTCFNNAAGEAAVNIGSMFSGDFTTPLSKIVPDSLTSTYDDFKKSDGYISTKVDYTQTALGAAGDITNCNYIQDLWTQVKSEPVQPDVPYYRYSDLVNAGSMPSGTATAPAATSNFYKDWNTSDGTDNDFGKVKTDIGALDKAATPTTFDPTYNNDDVCKVMNTANIIGTPTCP